MPYWWEKFIFGRKPTIDHVDFGDICKLFLLLLAAFTFEQSLNPSITHIL